MELTANDMGVIILTLQDLVNRMNQRKRSDNDLQYIYPMSKLVAQLDTAWHALGACDVEKPSDCAYERNIASHYWQFKEFIKAEIKPGNKTPEDEK